MIPLLLSAFLLNPVVSPYAAATTQNMEHELELPPVVINPRTVDDRDAHLQWSIIRDARDAIRLLLI